MISKPENKHLMDVWVLLNRCKTHLLALLLICFVVSGVIAETLPQRYNLTQDM